MGSGKIKYISGVELFDAKWKFPNIEFLTSQIILERIYNKQKLF